MFDFWCMIITETDWNLLEETAYEKHRNHHKKVIAETAGQRISSNRKSLCHGQ